MRTLPTTIVQVLAPFAPLFSERVFEHVQLLLAGAILTPGKWTVASVLRAVGLKQERRFCRYHRVLSRAAWSSREASRALLGLLVETFVPEGPLVVGIDETLERVMHSGENRIEMRIPRSGWLLHDLRFPHS